MAQFLSSQKEDYTVSIGGLEIKCSDDASILSEKDIQFQLYGGTQSSKVMRGKSILEKYVNAGMLIQAKQEERKKRATFINNPSFSNWMYTRLISEQIKPRNHHHRRIKLWMGV